MTDVLTKEQRSYNMSVIKSSNTKSTEITLAKLFRVYGIVGWRRNNKRIFGRPDFVFLKNKIAVFVDGCFWHGCPRCYISPKSNKAFWDKKIKTNIKRDRLVTKELKNKHWNVLRIWEHEIKKSPRGAIDKIRRIQANT